jgi:Holliday junction resolvase-like predicted endonuclease
MGEELASEWLLARLYHSFRNWRYARFEIDIIATKDRLCIY